MQECKYALISASILFTNRTIESRRSLRFFEIGRFRSACLPISWKTDKSVFLTCASDCIVIFLSTKCWRLTRFLSTSSGTFLVELHSALAALCEKITGALVVCRAVLIVLVETCERSTNMPSLFNSLTTAWGIINEEQCAFEIFLWKKSRMKTQY